MSIDEGLEALVERAAGTRLVLLGEATHGTHEFYAFRAALTMRLVSEHGFGAVAAEADWPDAYRVNCFVRGAGDDASAEDALGDFRRFPGWMWRNTVVVELVERLRAHNGASEAPCGFYGLGVVYVPESERASHYLQACPGGQFDALVHVDETSAVEPLERTSTWETGELPETYPTAL